MTVVNPPLTVLQAPVTANTLVAALGTATNKLPVVNAAGAVIGFVPVFVAIA